MRIRDLYGLLRQTYQEWSADKAPQLGAALAYYSVFSIAPLLIIAVAIASFVFGEAAAQGQISTQVRDTVGPTAAAAIEDVVAHSHRDGVGIWATVIGIGTLLIGAAGVFGQLQDALNTVWKVEPRPDRGWLVVLRERLVPFTMVLGAGFLLLVSLVVSAVLSALTEFLTPEALLGGASLWMVLNNLVSLGVITLLFAVIFKYLPDVRIAWTDVWIGALVTAVLFTVGKYLLGLYLGLSGVSSAFGAAGSLVLILVWVYYSAQIFLFGAELTRVYAIHRGSRVEPTDNAVPVSAENRVRQGMPHPPAHLESPGAVAR
jgi:membrane protein